MSIEQLKQELEKLGVKVHHRWGEARLQEELAKAHGATGGTPHMVTEDDLANNPGLEDSAKVGDVVIIPPADDEEDKPKKSNKVPRIMACNVSHDGVQFKKDDIVQLTPEMEAMFDEQGFLVK